MILPHCTNVAQVFARVVADRSNDPAIRWSDTSWTTYAELDAVSNQVARFLLDRHVQRRDTVCIAVDKSLAAYATLVACVKIGAAYFAVDPDGPPARLATMLERCRPAFAVDSASTRTKRFDCGTVDVDSADRNVAWAAGFNHEPIDLPWRVDAADPAYIMFTSGSTGFPKGVTISHSNLLQFIAWARVEYQIAPHDIVTNLNPLFFDNSVFDVYSSLFTGASLVPFTAAMLKEPQGVMNRLDALGCTIYFSVPSLLVYFQRLKLVDPESFKSVRTMVFGGEGYPKPMLVKLFDAIGRRTALYNVYGPTECTCICSSYRITGDDFADLNGYAPLGQLTSNFTHVILGDTGDEARPGQVGELLLGGPCVGLGYYADPDQTRTAFVQNPTHDRFFDRMYRTGDLVRYDATARKLHFVGRADTQIKRHGYRIELGEIEHALGAVTGVEEAAAIHLAANGTSGLVGIVAAKAAIEPGVIRRALADVLPRYMIPDRILVIAELPKNANGKIDRKALADAVGRGEL